MKTKERFVLKEFEKDFIMSTPHLKSEKVSEKENNMS